ncbi:hypothetical protein CSB45_09110 [candidate division KSB3 bacterium]|uniref:Triphosphoribosyl-dephospho-CoA synthase n=1 Tax=candidate division KSB3 bacterium TaxID=2044937 RepID=A0A2G6E4S2_9BACT|nr:MAG: hypothetical protein CSB45_09110 [candidate division KSB3 bacterium]PIE29628.1 MAG: hypothetical protein CSA57_07320 [candidate division KSB3 bacterium]
MDIHAIREKILAAKEKRAVLRAQHAAAGKACLSLSLNIPGLPKSSPQFSTFFECVLSELQQYLTARRIFIDSAHELCTRDAAGDFYLAALAEGNPITQHIKAQCEGFEASHPIGRAIDIDLTDCEGRPVSSGKLKPCFLCDQPALVCMRERHHSYQDLREELSTRITNYLKKQREDALCKRLSATALQAALYEISASPKPGLVDRFDTGAHQDMDYFSFLKSSAALAVYFEDFARAGIAFEHDDLTAALPIIRDSGLHMENAMFKATGGANTHKGLIFLLGLSIFATSFVLNRRETFDEADVQKTIAGICRNLVRNELNGQSHASSHGAQCFQLYGRVYGGARQEAEEGFPSVFKCGLPALTHSLLTAGNIVDASTLNSALIDTLLSLMAQVNDTNILYRATPEILMKVKHMAAHVLNALSDDDKSSRYAELLDFCRQHQISPGGSADLLVVSVFFYLVKEACSQGLGAYNSQSALSDTPKTDESQRTVP